MFSEKNQKYLFILAFVILGIVLMQIPFTALVGAKARFTMFDFFGPIVGGFLGSVTGLITVLAMQIANWAWHGFAVDAATIIRFFPMLAAVLYFSKKSKLLLAIPVIAMLAFWAHPEGRQAWPFALYWLIPIAMYFLHDRFNFARALGATFTAHAVGGALWIWTFNMKATIWMSLIPVVWKERGLMALGMVLAYVFFSALFSALAKQGWAKLSFLKLHNNA
jgi:hypothetical protein